MATKYCNKCVLERTEKKELDTLLSLVSKGTRCVFLFFLEYTLIVLAYFRNLNASPDDIHGNRTSRHQISNLFHKNFVQHGGSSYPALTGFVFSFSQTFNSRQCIIKHLRWVPSLSEKNKQ